jgi:hypothetical protein
VRQERPPPADPGEWYVAFWGTDRLGWWDVFTRFGFRHVMAFAYSSHAERWLIYDVCRHRTFVRAYKTDAFDLWLGELPEEVTVLKVPSPPDPKLRYQRAMFICTTAVKHLVGIRSRALRPHALFRDLLATGASFAFGTGPQDAIPENRPPAGRPG